MQRSLEYYFKGESSGVAAVSGSSSGLQKREKEKVMINVLFTKRRSIVAPKSRDNYPYILNVRHLPYFFWLFNSKLYGNNVWKGESVHCLTPRQLCCAVYHSRAFCEYISYVQSVVANPCITGKLLAFISKASCNARVGYYGLHI